MKLIKIHLHWTFRGRYNDLGHARLLETDGGWYWQMDEEHESGLDGWMFHTHVTTISAETAAAMLSAWDESEQDWRGVDFDQFEGGVVGWLLHIGVPERTIEAKRSVWAQQLVAATETGETNPKKQAKEMAAQQ